VKKTIAILLLILLMCGCSATEKVSQPASNSLSVEEKETTQETKKPTSEKITPSFDTKTYETSFIKFDYPASWFENQFNENYILYCVSNYPNPDFYDLSDPKQLEKHKKIIEQPLTSITIKRLDIEMKDSAKDVEDAKSKYIDYCNPIQQIEVLDNERYLTNNIGVLEAKAYQGTSVFHCNNYIHVKGTQIYCLELTTDEDNWDNIKEIVQVLEQSLEFFPEE
jgi:hypothetical protein